MKKKATFNINADLHKLLKVTAAVQDREMVEVLEEALGRYLETWRQDNIQETTNAQNN